MTLCPGGQLSGGDSTFSYTGNWKQDGEQFKMSVFAKRTEPGPPGVVGMDELDIVVTGYSDDGFSASCAGFCNAVARVKVGGHISPHSG